MKRLEAIDSLLKAVSSDQQLSKIETLVDELSSKLRAIEEQNALDDSSAEISDSVDSVHNDSHSDSLKKVIFSSSQFVSFSFVSADVIRFDLSKFLGISYTRRSG